MRSSWPSASALAHVALGRQTTSNQCRKEREDVESASAPPPARSGAAGSGDAGRCARPRPGTRDRRRCAAPRRRPSARRRPMSGTSRSGRWGRATSSASQLRTGPGARRTVPHLPVAIARPRSPRAPRRTRTPPLLERRRRRRAETSSASPRSAWAASRAQRASPSAHDRTVGGARPALDLELVDRPL